ncbi:hypothetical protein FXO38_28721 [Capsicum annuum]|nr:hypothetical protein FXO38_28721 [Capsicum annuum]KAF3666158.1 hypothetical protein FXO37_10708 [Capsicum annuum]
MLSSICHVRSVLHEGMHLESTSIDTLEILDAINITYVLESTYNDSDTEVADMVKSHLDSQLLVLGVEDTIPQCASIDATELKFSHVFLSVKGPLEIECKIDSLMGWMSLSPQQEQVEEILMLIGQIEWLSDYDYDSCVVYVPGSEFLSRIDPTDVNC